MSSPLVCPSCRVEIDPVSLERCTGCGLTFPDELQAELHGVYRQSPSEITFKQLVLRKRQVIDPAESDGGIPTAKPVDTIWITGKEAEPQSLRERWAGSLNARVALRAGVGLAVWSVLISPLGSLALVPAFAGLLLCVISLAGFEKYWALFGVTTSVAAIAAVMAVIQFQAFR